MQRFFNKALVGLQSYSFRRTFLWFGSLVLCTFMLAACDETHPIAWSPDGSKMALAAVDGLRIGDDTGRLSAPICPEARCIAWLPDSKRVLAAELVRVSTWSGLNGRLTNSQRQEILGLAQHIKAVLPVSGVNGLEKDAQIKDASSWLVAAALLYLQDTDSTMLMAHMEPDVKKELLHLSVDMHVLSVWDTSMGERGPVIWQGFGAIKEIKVAPDGRSMLFVHENAGKSSSYDIEVGSLDQGSADQGNKPLSMAATLTPHAAWTADSRQIVFFQNAAANDLQSNFDSLATIAVCNEAGQLLPSLSAPARLVNLVNDSSAGVACLADGRLIFNSAVVQLPATDDDLSGTQSLFSYRVGDPLSRRLLSHSDGERLKTISTLAVSPDGRHVALADAQAGVVEVVDIATGQADYMSMQPNSELSWRNNDEVCYVKPVEKPILHEHNAEVVLHSISARKDRIISKSWPQSAIDGFLTQAKGKAL